MGDSCITVKPTSIQRRVHIATIVNDAYRESVVTRLSWKSLSSIYILTVAQFDNINKEFLVINLIDNPIDALPDAVSVLSG